jgi:thiol-disulfide isomerase/thioredoxin
MKIILLILVIAMVTGCSSGQEGSVQTIESELVPPDENIKAILSTSLPDLGMAPELETSVWLNSAMPVRIRDLKGKVILLEMWTYGCINCRNVIPALKEWHSKYSGDGLVIIGNHYPEFDRERDLQN